MTDLDNLSTRKLNEMKKETRTAMELATNGELESLQAHYRAIGEAIARRKNQFTDDDFVVK